MLQFSDFVLHNSKVAFTKSKITKAISNYTSKLRNPALPSAQKKSHEKRRKRMSDAQNHSEDERIKHKKMKRGRKSLKSLKRGSDCDSDSGSASDSENISNDDGSDGPKANFR